jgi:arginyl-tRNA synthetase
MKPIATLLEERLTDAMKKASGLENCAALLKSATDAKFGDYQANGVMAVAKQLKTNPRQLAEKVVSRLDVSDICETPEVAGPGFINLRLKPEFIAKRLLEINADRVAWPVGADLRVCPKEGEHIGSPLPSDRLGISKTQDPKTIVVDFSGPNIAKQMHVGHLRSTIIGDAICRLLEFEGHKVIRQNHIGDWGTQFGMLTYYLDDQRLGTNGEASYLEISDLEDFYRKAKQLFDTNEEFANRSRDYVVKLQSGDKHVLFNWEVIRKQSISYCQELYNLLGAKLSKQDVCGESFYNPKLPDVIKDLKAKGLAVESDGAMCVFPPGFKNKEGQDLPLIVQKSDGAFLYATTDLAAIRYRVSELGAKKIIYVTDARQGLHFEMVFAVARMAGWVPDDVELVHVTFGSVLGEDGKPLKTRSGENVKLKELLDEAVVRAKAVVEQKNPELPPAKKEEIAKAVGIGAVKYADYTNNRTSDYIFSFDKMLAMEGNTAPYMQYAYARVKSIERKALEKAVDAVGELAAIKSITLTEPAETELAKQLARYDETIISAASDFRPNYLTAYLYDLAGKFSSFYTQCPVLTAEPPKRPTRLLLCDLTAKTIRHGMYNLLGIEVVEQM